MRKIFLLILTTLLLNCNQNPSYEEIAISKVKENLLDPNSFELIKVEKDTIFLSDILARKSQVDWEIFEQYEEIIRHKIDMAKISSYDRKTVLLYVDEAEVARDSMTAINERMQLNEETIKTIMGTTNDTIINFVYMVRCYATARNGNKVIGEYNARFDDVHNFIGLADANE